MELLGLSMGYVYSLHPKCGLRTPHMSGGSLSKHWELHGWWKVLIFIECSGRKENQEDWADSSRVEGSQGSVRLHTGVSGHCSSGDIDWEGAQELRRQPDRRGQLALEGQKWRAGTERAGWLSALEQAKAICLGNLPMTTDCGLCPPELSSSMWYTLGAIGGAKASWGETHKNRASSGLEEDWPQIQQWSPRV